MECVEKELPGKQTKQPAKKKMEKMAKLPSFLIKFLLKKNIKKIRAMMGGESKDITTRTIISEDKIISGYKNDLRIRIYKPEENVKRPLMVFFHGGGWIGGSLEAVEDYCKGVCDQTDCMVISVDYHLTPEHPYPEGVEDCYLAVKWAVKNKSELNIDENKIVVSGDSAGGNISAVLTLMAKDRKEFKKDLKQLFEQNNISVSKSVFRAVWRALSEQDETAKNCIDSKGNIEPDPDYPKIPFIPERIVSRFRDPEKGRLVLNQGEDYRPQKGEKWEY